MFCPFRAILRGWPGTPGRRFSAMPRRSALGCKCVSPLGYQARTARRLLRGRSSVLHSRLRFANGATNSGLTVLSHHLELSFDAAVARTDA